MSPILLHFSLSIVNFLHSSIPIFRSFHNALQSLNSPSYSLLLVDFTTRLLFLIAISITILNRVVDREWAFFKPFLTYKLISQMALNNFCIVTQLSSTSSLMRISGLLWRCSSEIHTGTAVQFSVFCIAVVTV